MCIKISIGSIYYQWGIIITDEVAQKQQNFITPIYQTNAKTSNLSTPTAKLSQNCKDVNSGGLTYLGPGHIPTEIHQIKFCEPIVKILSMKLD